jgi:ribosomal protein L5
VERTFSFIRSSSRSGWLARGDAVGCRSRLLSDAVRRLLSTTVTSIRKRYEDLRVVETRGDCRGGDRFMFREHFDGAR